MVITYAEGPDVTRDDCHGRVDFEVRLRDGSTETVTGADAYQQEHSMTTFFRTGGRRGIDCWSTRMASFRTDEILAVRRHER